MLALILLLNWVGAPPGATNMEKIQSLVGATLVFSGLTTVLLLIRRLFGSRFRGTLGEHTFDVSKSCIKESNATGTIETRLEGIRSVDETTNHFFVITKTGLGHVLPKRDLQDTQALQSLRDAVRACKS
ncbi:MAG: hypothetical protein QOF80_2293 [Verrucomicrobiota bacterium]